jgi:hypothetical protein
MTWIFVALYFLPPIGAMFVGPQMAIYNRVWLFQPRVAVLLAHPDLVYSEHLSMITRSMGTSI